MGVWIETKLCSLEYGKPKSHPVWVCGLKLTIKVLSFGLKSHTLYGCVD